MKIKVGCSMELQGCEIEQVIEIPDGSTEEEIEREVREWALEKFEYWHEVIPE